MKVFTEEFLKPSELNNNFGYTISRSLQNAFWLTCISCKGSYGNIIPFESAIVDIPSDSSGYLNYIDTGGATTAKYFAGLCEYTNLPSGAGTSIIDSVPLAYCCTLLCTCASTVINYSTTATCLYNQSNGCCLACVCAYTCVVSDDAIDLTSHPYFCFDINHCVSFNACLGYTGFLTSCAELTLMGCTFVDNISPTVNALSNCVVDCNIVIEGVKNLSGAWNILKNGVCVGDINCQCGGYVLKQTQYASGNGTCCRCHNGSSIICLNFYAYKDISATVISIVGQNFNHLMKGIVASVENVGCSTNDIKINVKTVAGAVIACCKNVNDLVAFSSCCNCVQVDFLLGSADFKRIKALGYVPIQVNQ